MLEYNLKNILYGKRKRHKIKRREREKMIISHEINEQIKSFSIIDHQNQECNDTIRKRLFFLSTYNHKYKRRNESMKQTLTSLENEMMYFQGCQLWISKWGFPIFEWGTFGVQLFFSMGYIVGVRSSCSKMNWLTGKLLGITSFREDKNVSNIFLAKARCTNCLYHKNYFFR